MKDREIALYYIGGPWDQHKSIVSKVPQSRVWVHEAQPVNPKTWLDPNGMAHGATMKTHEYHVKEVANNVFVAIHLELLW